MLKIARGVHYRWAHPRSEATSVLQLALCVEAEGIQRALCAVGVYHLLDRIDHLLAHILVEKPFQPERSDWPVVCSKRRRCSTKFGLPCRVTHQDTVWSIDEFERITDDLAWVPVCK